jgi:uncharacterized protein YjiS (DUF1127 family)
MTTQTVLQTQLPRLALPPLWRWIAVARERRRLTELDDHVLRDIGITRVKARREAARPFWDLPDR